MHALLTRQVLSQISFLRLRRFPYVVSRSPGFSPGPVCDPRTERVRTAGARIINLPLTKEPQVLQTQSV